MNKKIISSFVSILVLTTSASYSVNDSEELKQRQAIVSKQLEEHQKVNNRNGPSKTFFEAILKEEKFEPMGGYPGIVLNTDPLRELNKQANKAKHEWDKPFVVSNAQYYTPYPYHTSYQNNQNRGGYYVYPSNYVSSSSGSWTSLSNPGVPWY